MEEEKKTEENTSEENTSEENTSEENTSEEKNAEMKGEPVITRSMVDEACPTCGAEAPSMPAVLPDPSWSTEKLIAATKDQHMLVRSNAIILLSKRNPSETIESLIEALKDEEYLVKSNAMVAIAAYGKQVSDRMIQALEDQDKDVRAGAAWVVGELKDNRAVAALEKVAKDEYPLARIQAKASLVAMGKRPKKQEAGLSEEATVAKTSEEANAPKEAETSGAEENREEPSE